MRKDYAPEGAIVFASQHSLCMFKPRLRQEVVLRTAYYSGCAAGSEVPKEGRSLGRKLLRDWYGLAGLTLSILTNP